MVKIGRATVDLIQGDIADQEVDAVVNAANDCLWMGSGVAGAIRHKGGAEIEREAVAQCPIPIGESVITGAGGLKAKYVIHAAGMGQDLRADEEKVVAATSSALLRATENQLESIAFPAIGAGVGGLSVHLCARAMIDVVVDHLLGSSSLTCVRFVLFDERTHEAFHDYLLQKFSARS